MLTVELLGPLRVSVAGRPVELPAGRLRALLAVLAMSAGRAVPTDRLATAVWGADAHGDPRTNVRTNVKRLRRALDTAAELVAARPGGYLLAVDPDQVDALRFDRLLDEAAAESDPVVERTRLAAALALWRGTPFDGVRSDWLEQATAPALHERYLTAVERRIDLDLVSGARPDPTELSELAERNPLRESLWARLLRVLEAAGRPAEALERYDAIRRRLADELGTDPSPEIRQVHADLLAGGTAPGRHAVPRQLPAAVDGFAGRTAELAALDALLDRPDEAGSGSPRIAVITGTAGVGKTTLALHWAHRVAERFPDGQLHVDLRGYDPSGGAAPAAAIRDLLDALRVPPHRIPDGRAAQAGLYRSLLAGRRMLVLLDNARCAEQVVPLLPGTPGCLVVVTSRDQLTGLVVTYGARPSTLDLLPPGEAAQLLAGRLGRARIAAEPRAVAEIVRRCAGLPLALAIVAARAAIRPTHPLGALAGELRDALGALESAVDVRRIFSWSYETLSAEAARLFRLAAGLHPGPDCTIAAAASSAGVPVRRVRAAVAELTRANLLTEHGTGRYSCHDLLRAYASELCAAHDPDRDAARHRIVDHYVHTADAAAQHLQFRAYAGNSTLGPPLPGVAVADVAGADEAIAWFTAERPALLACLEPAADLGLDRHLCHLARALYVSLHRQGRWQERAEAQRAAVAAAHRLGDAAEEACAHRNLAVALADLGRFDEAHHHLDTALELSRHDLTGQAWTHYHRDLVHVIHGREAEALAAARRAHDLFDQVGDEVGQAIALTDLGWYHGRLGDHELALELCEQALVLHQKLGNRPHEAHAWSCLAEVHLTRGAPSCAVPCHLRALELFREVGDLYAEAGTLAHLGACEHEAGDRAAAHDHWRRAHALLADHDPSTIDQIHAQLATAVGASTADAFRRAAC